MPASTRDDDACDVLVVGAGAAGLFTAIAASLHGLKVCVLEKDTHIGGCSTYSVGMLWIPDSPVARRAGIRDERESVLAYLRAEMGERYDEDSIKAFLDHAPQVVAFLEAECGLRMELRENLPDYHSEAPGASLRGRSIVPGPFDGRSLGRDFHRLRPARPHLFGLTFTPAEIRRLSSRSLSAVLHLGGLLLRQAVDLLRFGRSSRLTGGHALVAALLKKAQALRIPIHTRSPVHGLLREGGRIAGVRLRDASGEHVLRARRGVVLACGGFGQDLDRCAHWLGHPPLDQRSWSLAPASCGGDGIRLAAAQGAAEDRDLSTGAFWAPVSRFPDTRHPLTLHSHDRFRPGYLAITPTGRRFANEAESNHHFCQSLLAATPAGQSPQAWIVCDHEAITRIGLGDRVHGWPFPLSPHLRSGYLLRRPGLAELAEAMGVDATVFTATVAAYNHDAEAGVDTAFDKGGSRFNRAMSRPSARPNPCLRPLLRGPYYAVKISVGHMATLIGLRADIEGRALDAGGQPVPGLYLAGNDRSNLFRGACPGGGITLAPGLTWAWFTGMSLAGASPVHDITPPAAPPARAALPIRQAATVL